MLADDSSDSAHLNFRKAAVPGKVTWFQPEFCRAGIPPDVDVPGLAAISRKEEEPVGSNLQDRGHQGSPNRKTSLIRGAAGFFYATFR